MQFCYPKNTKIAFKVKSQSQISPITNHISVSPRAVEMGCKNLGFSLKETLKSPNFRFLKVFLEKHL